MDRFDTVFSGLGDGKVRELREKCICAGCPTYNPCAAEAKELLYCIYGQSFRCVTEDFGCVCPECPLIDEIGLEYLTFCLKGGEASQRYRERLSPQG
ncbi:MAG TPA: DUF2769 domain-containing protein [Methanomicrobiales archaeon]|nr:DUF2769 domain-containing protein [Methanomicrobiales archaeon]